jgi:hypothetical protein
LPEDVDLVHVAGQMRMEDDVGFLESPAVNVAENCGGRILYNLVHVLGAVHVETPIDGLELEVGDGRVELNVQERVPDGFVDSRALVSLVV